MGLDDRKAIIKEIESILYPLKNSVNKHMIDGNIKALRKMVNSTVDELKKIAKDLSMMGCTKTAVFIRDYSNFMVTFARLAVEDGRDVPWNSNIIERLMGEISKRVKHKWMRWTTRGLEAILNIILVRYTCESHYEDFRAKIMRSKNLTFINIQASIMSVGGEF